MSVDALEREFRHWAGRYMDEDLLGRAPRPGKGLIRAGAISSAGGNLSTFAGTLGFAIPVVSAVATTVGVGLAGFGLLIAARSEKEIEDQAEAEVRVNGRLRSIDRELTRRGFPRDQQVRE